MLPTPFIPQTGFLVNSHYQHIATIKPRYLDQAYTMSLTIPLHVAKFLLLPEPLAKITPLTSCADVITMLSLAPSVRLRSCAILGRLQVDKFIFLLLTSVISIFRYSRNFVTPLSAKENLDKHNSPMCSKQISSQHLLVILKQGLQL